MPAARLARPEDLVVLLPFILGYRPRDCLVVVGLRSVALGVVQAAQWPPPWGRPAPEWGERLARGVVWDGCDGALLVAFDERFPRHVAALDDVTATLVAAGLTVPDRILVGAAGRWRSLDCADACCCPPGGRDLPDVATVPAVAEWVLRGVYPYADRAAMAAAIEPTAGLTGFDFDGLDTGERARPPSPEAARAAWAAVLCGSEAGGADPAEHIPPALAWQAATAASVPAVRDDILQWLCPGLLGAAAAPHGPAESRPSPSGPGAGTPSFRPDDSMGDRGRAEEATGEWPGGARSSAGPPRTPYDVLGAGAATAHLLRRLTEFARRLPEEHRGDTLVLTAVCAWWYGHGTLARICLDRAHELVPGHRLGALVEAMLDTGMRPHRDCA